MPPVPSRVETDPITLEGRPAGSMLRLVSVEGEPDRALRLLSLGLQLGEVVTVSHQRSGGVVVAVHGVRIAVGRELARQVHVEPVPAAESAPASAHGGAS